jgi:hypothetical protein
MNLLNLLFLFTIKKGFHNEMQINNKKININNISIDKKNNGINYPYPYDKNKMIYNNNYFENIYTKQKILALLENENINNNYKLELIEHTNIIKNKKKIYLLAGGLYDDWNFDF